MPGRDKPYTASQVWMIRAIYFFRSSLFILWINLIWVQWEEIWSVTLTKEEREKERTFPFLRPFNSNQIDFKKSRHFSYLNKFNSRERKKQGKEKDPIPLWSLIRGNIISAVTTCVSVHSALWNAKLSANSCSYVEICHVNDRIYDYFGPGLHMFSLMKQVKARLSQEFL